MSLILNVHGKCFSLKARIQKFSKLVEISCLQEIKSKRTDLQFLCTQGTLQGERVEDHGLMFTRHLHSPQLYIQAVLYLYKTDYMMSLTLYTLISVYIFSMLFSIHFLMCWEGEFV